MSKEKTYEIEVKFCERNLVFRGLNSSESSTIQTLLTSPSHLKYRHLHHKGVDYFFNTEQIQYISKAEEK